MKPPFELPELAGRRPAGLLPTGSPRPAAGRAGELHHPAPSRVQPVPPLPDDRRPARRRLQRRAGGGLVGRRVDRAGPVRPGHPPRLHRAGARVDGRAPDAVPVFGPRARRRAGLLRDACRRFAVDTDRVFLTGYSIGGDAAWDLGLAHPDLWAGVMPIAAESSAICSLYWGNAKTLPFYLVSGELDGGRMARNARDLDRYLKNGFNATVVQYLGRGHEHYSDEQLRLFDWMGRFHRDFFPHEFPARRCGSGTIIFWWAEIRGQPPAHDGRRRATGRPPATPCPCRSRATAGPTTTSRSAPAPRRPPSGSPRKWSTSRRGSTSPSTATR